MSLLVLSSNNDAMCCCLNAFLIIRINLPERRDDLSEIRYMF